MLLLSLLFIVSSDELKGFSRFVIHSKTVQSHKVTYFGGGGVFYVKNSYFC